MLKGVGIISTAVG